MTPTPEAVMRQAREALESARQFIKNGRELGYIRMPDADCPDPAHATPGKIDAALSGLRSLLDGPAGPTAAHELHKMLDAIYELHDPAQQDEAYRLHCEAANLAYRLAAAPVGPTEQPDSSDSTPRADSAPTVSEARNG